MFNVFLRYIAVSNIRRQKEQEQKLFSAIFNIFFCVSYLSTYYFFNVDVFSVLEL